jgi:hypothetical protein
MPHQLPCTCLYQSAIGNGDKIRRQRDMIVAAAGHESCFSASSTQHHQTATTKRPPSTTRPDDGAAAAAACCPGPTSKQARYRGGLGERSAFPVPRPSPATFRAEERGSRPSHSLSPCKPARDVGPCRSPPFPRNGARRPGRGFRTTHGRMGARRRRMVCLVTTPVRPPGFNG